MPALLPALWHLARLPAPNASPRSQGPHPTCCPPCPTTLSGHRALTALSSQYQPALTTVKMQTAKQDTAEPQISYGMATPMRTRAPVSFLPFHRRCPPPLPALLSHSQPPLTLPPRERKADPCKGQLMRKLFASRSAIPAGEEQGSSWVVGLSDDNKAAQPEHATSSNARLLPLFWENKRGTRPFLARSCPV